MYEDIHIIRKCKDFFLRTKGEILMAYDGDNEAEDLSEIISISGIENRHDMSVEHAIIRSRLTEAGFNSIYFELKVGAPVRFLTANDKDGNFRRMFYI